MLVYTFLNELKSVLKCTTCIEIEKNVLAYSDYMEWIYGIWLKRTYRIFALHITSGSVNTKF